MPKEKNEAPDSGDQEPTEELIRLRAYKLFEDRGYEHGHDVDDWLQAEVEIVAKKPVARADRSATLAKAAAA